MAALGKLLYGVACLTAGAAFFVGVLCFVEAAMLRPPATWASIAIGLAYWGLALVAWMFGWVLRYFFART